MKSLFTSSFLLFISSICFSQTTFQYGKDVAVVLDGVELSEPWNGGLNSAQFSEIDLDLDGTLDLFVFDRHSNTIATFLYKDGAYIFAPEYALLFPPDLQSWVLLRDYNCDGQADIFTYTAFGVALYENTSDTNLSFELVVNPILSLGFSGNINIKINPDDVPLIEDLDGDGDLDIANFNFSGTGGIEFHQNMSVENTGLCSNLELVRINRFWGDFKECGCGVFAFNGEDCPPSGGKIEHVVGKSMFSYDYNKDGVLDLAFAEDGCGTMYILPNSGSNTVPKFTKAAINFPSANQPISGFSFPSAYKIDLDHDGDLDIVASQNSRLENTFYTNHEKSIHAYSNSNNNYTLETIGFLQNNGIDLGSHAFSQFYDYDADGDLDLFVSSKNRAFGKPENASISLFQNEGSAIAPKFVLTVEDVFNFSFSGISDFQFFFKDINGDSKPDFILKSNWPNGASSLNYFEAIPSENFNFDFRTAYEIEISTSRWDNIFPFDVNSDGVLDFLVGKNNGSLHLYKGLNASNPSYVLSTENYYGFEFDFLKRNLNPLVADVDGNGTADLIVTHAQGTIELFPDFQQSVSNPKEPILLSIQQENATYSYSGGLQNYLAVANIKSSNTPQLFITTMQGGIHYLINTEEKGAGSALEPQVYVYPVPIYAGQQAMIKVGVSESMSVVIHDLQGKQITLPNQILSGEEKTIDASTLPSGTFIISGVKDGKIIASERLIIFR